MGYDVFFTSKPYKKLLFYLYQNNSKYDLPKESFGQLVVLGFDVTVFTPAPYQRRRLQRPSMEF